MALDLCQNLVSTQYLENKSIVPLDWDKNFVSTQYLENKSTEISPNFIYALILTRSMLGLLAVIFSLICNKL